MTATQPGTIHLFRAGGINVFLHWSWFLVAAYVLAVRKDYYASIAWNVAEYLALFAIVLLHEFGHALACRQVGGTANRIVLWPLGGVAFVAPPLRPGAELWSIAAGPLVNVLLVPLLYCAGELAGGFPAPARNPDLPRFLHDLQRLNLLLLFFNLLPVFPLDGGQILRSLLWFRLGRWRSLVAATLVGFAGLGALAVLAIVQRSWWMGAVVLYLFSGCYDAFKHAQAASKQSRRPPTEPDSR